jgi:hypothetical protein
MRLKHAVWMGLGLYALLSVTDWVMTFALLRLHPGAIEANPLAAACLERYGWNGLALYKFGGVLAFVGAVALLVRRRPVLATGVVALGCAVLLSVTIYTHGLLITAHREAREEADAAWGKPKPSAKAQTGPHIPERCWFAPPVAPTAATAVSSAKK